MLACFNQTLMKSVGGGPDTDNMDAASGGGGG